jgi:hypothetical protein
MKRRKRKGQRRKGKKKDRGKNERTERIFHFLCLKWNICDIIYNIIYTFFNPNVLVFLLSISVFKRFAFSIRLRITIVKLQRIQ